MQGKEIFRLQQRGLGVETHHQQLQGEIEGTNEYLQVLHEERAAQQSNSLARYAVVIGLIAALPVVNDLFKTEPSMWQSITEFFGGCAPSMEKEGEAISCNDSTIRLAILGVLACGIFALYLIAPWLKSFLHCITSRFKGLLNLFKK